MSRTRHLVVALLAALALLLAGCTELRLQPGSSVPPPGSTPQLATTEGAPDGSGDGSSTDPASGLPWVSVADLPPEAEETLDLIDAGGPFPYDKDGSTFGNHEGVLPEEPKGFYREYTVETPGLSHRGPQRIVTGGEDTPATDDDVFYWTADHYESFDRIAR